MKKSAGFLFVFLVYSFTWSIDIPVALTQYGYLSVNISKGLQTLSTLAPGIVATILTAIFFGKQGVTSLLKPVLRWKVKFVWYLIVIVIGIILPAISLVIFDAVSEKITKLEQPITFLFYFLFFLPFSALWEEIGWRGFLLPTLQKRYTAIQVSLIIGFVWGLWHLPVYLALNPYGDKTIVYFLVMLIGCFPLSILQTWLYNSTKGCLLICILLHNTINSSAAYFYKNLSGNEFRPIEILIVLLLAAAIIIYIKTKGILRTYKNADSNTTANIEHQSF